MMMSAPATAVPMPVDTGTARHSRTPRFCEGHDCFNDLMLGSTGHFPRDMRSYAAAVGAGHLGSHMLGADSNSHYALPVPRAVSAQPPTGGHCTPTPHGATATGR